MAHILLVDDEQLVVDTLQAAMQSKGHTVETACNGIEGLLRYARGHFDLVITDIIMPDKEGIGMMLEMRRENPDAKIIAISGGGRTGNVEFLKMAAKLGAVATLKKPIRLAEFFQMLDDCLALKDGAEPAPQRPDTRPGLPF
jgi:DNA-binding NtrC family response regulator